MEFKITELALLAQSDVKYNPALGIAVNKLYNTRSKTEYQLALQEATQIAVGYENVNLVKRKDYGTSSNLAGMPLFQPLEFQEQEGLEVLLFESAIADFSRTKNIVSTIIQGRDTSVDEFINNGDWQINVTGILCSNEPRYPLEEVLAFEAFMALNTPIKINHEIMNALGIYEIVILNYALPKTPSINLQSYSFSAKSTKPLPLIIEDKPTETII